MNKKEIQRLVEELERTRKGPQNPETEKKIKDLCFRIAKRISKRTLKKALEHPPEIRNFIHPQDTSRHPLLV